MAKRFMGGIVLLSTLGGVLSLPIIFRDYIEMGIWTGLLALANDFIAWLGKSIEIPTWLLLLLVLFFFFSVYIHLKENISSYLHQILASIKETISDSKDTLLFLSSQKEKFIGTYKVVDKQYAQQPRDLHGGAGYLDSDGNWLIDLNIANGNGIYGPYIDLNPNKYRVIFRLKINSNQGANIPLVALDITSNIGHKQFIMRQISLSDFKKSNHYQDFNLDFELTEPAKNIEFRINTYARKIDNRLTIASVKLFHL